MLRLKLLSAAMTLALLAPAVASAAQPKLITKSGKWEAYSYNDSDNGGLICYIGSVPEKAEGKYTSRGDTYVLVTHRPNANNNNEVSFVAGYTYKDGSEVSVKIGSRTRKLFTYKDSAWARDSKTDEALVKAMRKGSTMVVKGSSSRGTLTTDTYSLKGFTAAYNAISKECNVRGVR